jgi:hypothetical protein
MRKVSRFQGFKVSRFQRFKDSMIGDSGLTARGFGLANPSTLDL